MVNHKQKFPFGIPKDPHTPVHSCVQTPSQNNFFSLQCAVVFFCFATVCAVCVLVHVCRVVF